MCVNLMPRKLFFLLNFKCTIMFSAAGPRKRVDGISDYDQRREITGLKYRYETCRATGRVYLELLAILELYGYSRTSRLEGVGLMDKAPDAEFLDAKHCGLMLTMLLHIFGYHKLERGEKEEKCIEHEKKE